MNKTRESGLPTVQVVIPTIYSRPDLLPLAVNSVLQQEGVRVSVEIYCPSQNVEKLEKLFSDARVKVLSEASSHNLATKIDFALRETVSQYQTWLGDDDLLTIDSLKTSVGILEDAPDVAMVYGRCDYIDRDGRLLFTNNSGPWAAGLLRFGPQLIPQPGAVWRSTAFKEVGGLDSQFNLAFDFELFRKLSKVGELRHVQKVLAQFRWHPDSLSVRRRWSSVTEASRVRRKHYVGLARLIWPLWEPWVMVATWAAGKLLTIQLKLSRQSSDPS